MRFSSRFGTAIHTLLIIHEGCKEQKVTSDFIAEKIGKSSVFVRTLLGDFKKAGVVYIAPRKEKEGTKLARPLNKITLFDIFEIVEPDHLKNLCETSTRIFHRCHAGQYVNEIISGYLEDVIDVVRAELKKTTLADTLASLEMREAASLHKNTRDLFPME